ncbi:VIT and VWA domain-containing protein [bacterium]|nr:VIT and VWA domain-containing protein [bacterium]
MKQGIAYFTITVCVLFISQSPVFSQEGDQENIDKTLSPYFVVLTDDPTIDQLPLKSTRADIDIAGVIANVTVTQTYENHGTRALEAIYVFPLSTNAAVYAMRMYVGNILIEAEIKEREEARQEYEDAVEEGKTASLLEQNRPNVFQMNVGNILPGDTIRVEVAYVELIVPENGVYELTYPAVVGPRYSEQVESDGDTEQWIATPYEHEGEDALYEFDVAAHINSGVPLQSIYSPSHDVVITYPDEQSADIVLSTTERAGLKDYRLLYNLRGNEIETGVLLYEHEDENFFLVMVEPPQRIVEDEIPPREYLFVIDVSGSMYGFPLDVARSFLNLLLSDLRPNDVFNVIAFAGGSYSIFDSSVPATPENIQEAISTLGGVYGSGSTRLLQALQHVFAMPLYSDDLARTTVIITDGYIGFEYAVFDEIRANLNLSNVFSAGIGSSPNRFLIEGMANVGQGQPLFIENPEESEFKLAKYKEYIKEPVLTHIHVNYNGFDAYEVEPPAVPDVFAQRPIILYGKYNGEANGLITLTGETALGPYEKTIDLSAAQAQKSNVALRYLWARKRIQLKSDYIAMYSNDELVAEVTQLGLKYNLLTPYTSFVAIYHEIRNDGELVEVDQPLPLPDGVSDNAVGGGGGAGGAVGITDWELYEVPTSKTKTVRVVEVIDAHTFKVSLNGRECLVQIDSVSLDSVGRARILEWLQEHLLNEKVEISFEGDLFGNDPVIVKIQWRNRPLSEFLKALVQ